MKKSGEYIRGILAGSGIEWETLSFTTQPPILSKIYDQRKINAKALRLYKEKKFDLIHCRSYVAAAAGLKLFRRYGVPFLFDMRGFWVDERVDSGLWILKNPFYKFIYKKYKKKEKDYFFHAGHVISLTHKGKDELVQTYHVSAGKISVIPCCTDLQHFDYTRINDIEKQKAKTRLGLAGHARVLTYLGSLGGWYLTDEMLDFFVVVKKKFPDAVFLFITHDKREEIIKKAAGKEIAAQDIRVHPAGRREVPLYLSVSDWCIFFIKDCYSKKASSPTKQGEIMAMGIPLLCNDIGDTGRIVKESGVGVVINRFSPAEYEKAADSMAKLLLPDKAGIRHSAFKYYNLQDGVETYNKVYRRLTEKENQNRPSI